MPQFIGEYLDRLLSTEVRPGSGNVPRGVVHRLYQAVRDRVGGPLVLNMAEALNCAVTPGASVWILTGAGTESLGLPRAEIDGIPGAVTLGRTLATIYHANVSIFVEERVIQPVKEVIRAAAMNPHQAGARPIKASITFEASPTTEPEIKRFADRIFADDEPSAIIAIEKLGPNAKGIIHGATGLDVHEGHTDPTYIIETARRNNILTCGIGDNGNEAGFGAIRDEVASIMPAGAQCGCPCGAGSATVLSTDKVLPAAISDWGAYALVAMMSYLKQDLSTLVTPEDLDAMLRAAIAAGSLDGVTGKPTLSDDGVPLTSQLAYVTLLADIVSVGATHIDSPIH